MSTTQEGIIMDNKYVVAWIPPDPAFDEKIVVEGFANLALANKAALKLNRETQGSLGRYEAKAV